MIPNPICWFKAFLRSFISPGTLLAPLGPVVARSSGHSFVEIEQHDNVYVSILRCSVCGKVEIGWCHDPFVSPRPNKCKCQEVRQ